MLLLSGRVGTCSGLMVGLTRRGKIHITDINIDTGLDRNHSTLNLVDDIVH